ncbi:MAG TPA: hypothetical protein VFA46_24475 [Actinomycetes bacterium]|nr:hypothetical protein [Actinomycetes bacterium]
MAPALEWNPADGMHGLLYRLELWLRQAAIGDLDPVGMPLHPPVTYPVALDTPLVIPRADIGEVINPRLVFAQLQQRKPGRVDVVGWERSPDGLTPPIALAALTPGAWGSPSRTASLACSPPLTVSTCRSRSSSLTSSPPGPEQSVWTGARSARPPRGDRAARCGHADGRLRRAAC